MDSTPFPTNVCIKPLYKTSLLLPLPVVYCRFPLLRPLSFSFPRALSADHRSNLKDLPSLCNYDGDDYALAVVFLAT